MTHWRLSTMNLHEILRRLRAGDTERSISRALNISRNTIRDYRQWAGAQGLLAGELPDLVSLERLRGHTGLAQSRARRTPTSQLQAYRPEVSELLTRHGNKPRLIWTLLHERHPDFTGSESAVWRLTRSLRAEQPPASVVRIETAPGDVAQVDFGYVGTLLEERTGRLRKAWVFSMVLAWSRHMYAEIVPDQSVTTWLLCHQRAFEFFNAVPRRVVLDNLKAAIIHAYTIRQDVEVQQAYRECAEHYGFLIDPCLPRKPQHKGKVERGGVGYLKQSFVPLLPEGTTFHDGNQRLRQWLLGTAGMRTHGTTQALPLARFEQIEQAALQALPRNPYDPAVWKQAKLHRDGHVVFERSFYSAPHRLVGQTLWLRAGLREVRLFGSDFSLVATHSRAAEPGQRSTHPDHLPPEKLRGLTASRTGCLAEAQGIGPHTVQVITEYLESRPVDRLRSALHVLTLAERYTPPRLEAACARGLTFGDTSVRTLQRMLEHGLDQSVPPLPVPATPPAGASATFARPAEELARAILGGASWN